MEKHYKQIDYDMVFGKRVLQCASSSDIQYLPTTTTLGEYNEYAAVGSLCICEADSSIWILKINSTWAKWGS